MAGPLDQEVHLVPRQTPSGGDGRRQVTEFLTSLAVHGKVTAVTQNQALSAVLFLYREVLSVELPWLDGLVRAKPPQRLPVVLTREEVRTAALAS